MVIVPRSSFTYRTRGPRAHVRGVEFGGLGAGSPHLPE